MVALQARKVSPQPYTPPVTLRRLPTDFRVIEALDRGWLDGLSPTATPDHPNALYVLTKVGQTTPEAVAHLARALAVPTGRIAYAGLKDKHAQTTQHVTVPAPITANRAGVRADLARELQGPHWSARLIAWAREPIPAGAIARNRFEIVIRDLTRGAVNQLLAAADWLVGTPVAFNTPVGACLIPNYFGDQRFGSARHHQGFAARALIQGDFEGALKLLIATPARKDSGARRTFTRACASAWGQRDWRALARVLPALPERRAIESLAQSSDKTQDAFRDAFAALPNFLQQLCVDAYQSFLWNAAAARCVIDHASAAPSVANASPSREGPDSPGLDLLTREGAFGTLVFATSHALAPLTTRQLAMPSPDALAPPTVDSRTKPCLVAALQAEGLTLDQLTIPGLRRPRFGGAPRPLVAHVDAFTIHEPEPDELARQKGRWKLAVGFALPRGAYATTLLRALGQ